MSDGVQLREWFDAPDEQTGKGGLRFACTMCGNCCTGPEGYVLVNDQECAALAARLGMTAAEFVERYTHVLPVGRSLIERITSFGNDCVFLDREKVPGKAVCGVYEDRPRQCRTWPFWDSIMRSRRDWERAARVCPGIDKGHFVPADKIRIQRAVVKI